MYVTVLGFTATSYTVTAALAPTNGRWGPSPHPYPNPYHNMAPTNGRWGPSPNPYPNPYHNMAPINGR